MLQKYYLKISVPQKYYLEISVLQRREQNIIRWGCQYFHHIVVLPIRALNLIIERGEIMEMIKKGKSEYFPSARLL